MTLWIDDGTDEGFLANCGNCVFAMDDPTENELTCGWNPPVPMRTPNSIGLPAGVPAWMRPLVQPDQHCHNHPMVQRWTAEMIVCANELEQDFHVLLQGLRRPEDRDK